jgi:hypothetical protein
VLEVEPSADLDDPEILMSQIFKILIKNYEYPEPYLRHLDELLSDYYRSGMASPHLLHELSTGEEGKLYARTWEAILYKHLMSLGREFLPIPVRKSGEDGPDFGIVYSGKRIWIEAIVPAPEGIPSEWLTPPKIGEYKVRSMPHEAMLLRWTHALTTKKARIDAYISKGIIAEGDCVVVAINACRLSEFSFDDHGVSQLPFAVESVFPIGPLAIPISKDAKMEGNPTRMLRYSIKKSNGADIPTANFLNPEFSRISGIIGCVQRQVVNEDPQLTLVNNPLAEFALPPTVFGGVAEYCATKQDEEFLLERVR